MNSSRNNPEDFASTLKKLSLKATPQRMAVNRAMYKLGHASADMVAEEITADGTVKVTVASVYNILSDFADRGIYSRRLSANNKMFFDFNTSNHIHFYDIENNSYRDVADDRSLDEILKKLARKRFKGYKVDYIDIQIIGRPTRRKPR